MVGVCFMVHAYGVFVSRCVSRHCDCGCLMVLLLLLLLDVVGFGHVFFLCLAFLFGESVFLSSSVSIEFGSFVCRGCLL